MKLLFVTSNLVAGGAERQWQRLAIGLARAGHDPRVVALDSGGPVLDGLRAGSVPATVVGIRSRYDVARLFRVPELSDFVPDVVISRDTSGMCVACAIAKLRGIPHVHTDHRQVGLELNPRRELLMRLNARWLDQVVLVSPRQRPMWDAKHVAPSDLTVIHNGVDAPPAVDRAALRGELGLGSDDVAVMMTATLRPEKRVSDFVVAMKTAQLGNGHLVGVIAGGGEQLEVARSMTAGDGVFRVLGHRDDVSALLGAADMFVLPSGMEAQPLAILEAMAAGLPILATDVGDLPDLVEDDVNGRRFAVGDVATLASHLSDLAVRPALRAQWGAESRARWERSWRADVMVSRYEEVFSAVVGRSPVRPARTRRVLSRALGWT